MANQTSDLINDYSNRQLLTQRSLLLPEVGLELCLKTSVHTAGRGNPEKVRERMWGGYVCECERVYVGSGGRGEEMEQNKMENERLGENVWKFSSLIWKYRLTCEKTMS